MPAQLHEKEDDINRMLKENKHSKRRKKLGRWVQVFVISVLIFGFAVSSVTAVMTLDDIAKAIVGGVNKYTVGQAVKDLSLEDINKIVNSPETVPKSIKQKQILGCLTSVGAEKDPGKEFVITKDNVGYIGSEMEDGTIRVKKAGDYAGKSMKGKAKMIIEKSAGDDAGWWMGGDSELIIHGNAGDEAGTGMYGNAKLTIEGNAGDNAGLGMKENSRLDIRGKTGKNLGLDIMSGEITVHCDGVTGWCTPVGDEHGVGHTMWDGKITIEGNSYEVGREMKEGEIIVEGNSHHVGNIDMRGGKITIKGDAEGFVGQAMAGGEISIGGSANEVQLQAGGKITVKKDIGKVSDMHGGELRCYGDVRIDTIEGKMLGGKIYAKQFHGGIDVGVVWENQLSDMSGKKTELWKLDLTEFSDELVDSFIRTKNVELEKYMKANPDVKGIRYGWINHNNIKFVDFDGIEHVIGLKISKMLKFTKNKVEVTEADGTKHTYTLDDFPETTLKDGSVVSTGDGKVVIKRNGLPKDVGVIMEGDDLVIIHDLPDGYQMKATHYVDALGGRSKAMISMDSGAPGELTKGHGNVLIEEAGEVTTMQKIRQLDSATYELGKKGIVRKFVKGGKIVGRGVAGLYLGSVTTFALIGITGGDWMWVAPAVTADTITAVLVLKGVTSFGKATLIGAVVGETVSIVIHSVEEHQLNALREDCGVTEASAPDTIVGGIQGWADSWVDMFKLVTSSERSCTSRDSINRWFSEDMRKCAVDRGASEDDGRELAKRELSKGKYQQKFNERVMTKVYDAILYLHPTPAPYGALPAHAWVQDVLEGKIDPDYKIDKSSEEVASEVSVELCKLYVEWKEDETLELYEVDPAYEDLVLAAKNGIEGIMEQLGDSKELGANDMRCGLLNLDVKIYQNGDDTVVLYPETGVLYMTWPILKTGKATDYLNEVIDQIVPISGPADGLLEVKITNTHTKDITCPGSGKDNTDKIKWEIQENCAGAFIDYSDTCLENPEITINPGENVNIECWTNDAPPKSTGPHCARITWCGKITEFTG